MNKGNISASIDAMHGDEGAQVILMFKKRKHSHTDCIIIQFISIPPESGFLFYFFIHNL